MNMSIPREEGDFASVGQHELQVDGRLSFFVQIYERTGKEQS